MTRREYTFERNLDFSQWVRHHLKDSSRGLITQDIDFVFVNYCTGWFILLEVKTQRRSPRLHLRPASTVIFSMLDELLRTASRKNGEAPFVRNPATGAAYRYLGAYLLEFINGTDPQNAEAIYLNGRSISADELRTFLNLDTEASLELARQYHSNWLHDLLDRQKSQLRGKCQD